MTDWEDYFYPGTDVLRNKLGIQDKEELQRAEVSLVKQRIAQGCPEGNFDLTHLQAIHRHLFQDVYEWAGQLRAVDMYKNMPGEYEPPDRIEKRMHEVHARMVQTKVLGTADASAFSAKAAEFIGDTNQVHPFREGNTRTQLQFLKQLGEQAGHNIDLTKIERDAWNEAKIAASFGSYGHMNDQIRAAIVPALEKTPLVEKRTLEQAIKDDELLRAQEFQAQRHMQQEALTDMVKTAERSGKDAAQKEANRRDFEKTCREQDATLARAQQERTERLELLHRGTPSGHER